ARLYRAGWAPGVVLVRGARREEWKALQDLRIEVKEGWEMSREVLIRQGVSPSAILVPEEEAEGTLEESQVAFRALKPENLPVILVTSKFHTRRTRLTWNYVTEGRSKAIVRAAGQDPFDPTRWWRQRRFVLSVVREYLGLVNYFAGFPVTP
ncbi:MAG TPA: ElyC/SanA/YdcF family protein, partial [Terriglobia bacterium]|nr:ElyC/SanA/YdcF family protein [Terriglobia bacterium]